MPKFDADAALQELREGGVTLSGWQLTLLKRIITRLAKEAFQRGWAAAERNHKEN